MRLDFTLACPALLAFDHLATLKSAFHHWTGYNAALHDEISLFSLSWLRGGRGGADGLRFPNGATWTISAPDTVLLQTLLTAVQKEPILPGQQLWVTEVRVRHPPAFEDGQHCFKLLSPVLVKQPRTGQHAMHLRYDDPAADQLLTAVLHRKLRQAGLDETGATVAFDRSYPTPKTKLFRYKQVQCRASMCPVIVTGSAAQLAFAWCVGVGHSTGIGCGALQ